MLFMRQCVGEYIENLGLQRGFSQADIARNIRVPRQSLSYVICGKRELSLVLALKLESFFSLPEGELMMMQVLQSMQQRKSLIKKELCDKLLQKNAFWSYDLNSHEDIPDAELIEKCFMFLDMEDIDRMFEIYPRKFIFNIWKERMAIQGDYLLRLNIMIAMYYFDIKEPEKFLVRVERQHINKLTNDARINKEH
jgi:plasmid maintenance system antidote protein VapI